MTTAAVSTGFDGLIPRMFGERRNAAKILARMSGASKRSAENWLAGRNTPQMEHAIKMMAECRELEAEVIRLVAELRAKS